MIGYVAQQLAVSVVSLAVGFALGRLERHHGAGRTPAQRWRTIGVAVGLVALGALLVLGGVAVTGRLR